MTKLKGKRILVTGAAQGLGRAIAEMFVARGARVMLSDIDGLGVAKVAVDLGDEARSVHCDVTSSADMQGAVDQTVKAFGGLDVMINNAGIEVIKPLFDHTEKEFLHVMDINVKGIFLGMKHSVQALAASGGGVIVNMSSVAGLAGGPLFGSYCASKAAVLQLTRVAALELRSLGIRVNAVCPGFIGTSMVDRMSPIIEAGVGVPFDQLVAMKQQRLGTVEEVAEMVFFLASEDASWTTGSYYVLDGGMTASLL